MTKVVILSSRAREEGDGIGPRTTLRDGFLRENRVVPASWVKLRRSRSVTLSLLRKTDKAALLRLFVTFLTLGLGRPESTKVVQGGPESSVKDSYSGMQGERKAA